MQATSSKREPKTSDPSKSAARLKLARQWHFYLGTLFAPSIIFFAFSGAMQLFGLHEIRPGRAYQPPAWIQKMGSIHKNQTLSPRHVPPPGFAGAQRQLAADSQARRSHQPDGDRRNLEQGSNKFTLSLGRVNTI